MKKSRPHRVARRALAGALAILLACAVPACGSDPKTPENETGMDVDGDALALLPGDPLALAHVDAKAFYASGTVGAQIGVMAERLIPIGEEWGFEASRDI